MAYLGHGQLHESLELFAQSHQTRPFPSARGWGLGMRLIHFTPSVMGVDNFFVVGGGPGGLCCHTQFCDHSYLLLDYHRGSGVINEPMRKWLITFGRNKSIIFNMEPQLDKLVHNYIVYGEKSGGGGFSPPSPPPPPIIYTLVSITVHIITFLHKKKQSCYSIMYSFYAYPKDKAVIP